MGLPLTLPVSHMLFAQLQFGINQTKQVSKTQIDGAVLADAIVKANAHGGDELLFVVGKSYARWSESCVAIVLAP